MRRLFTARFSVADMLASNVLVVAGVYETVAGVALALFVSTIVLTVSSVVQHTKENK